MQLSNNPAYKQLQEAEGENSSPSDIFTKCSSIRGPWTEIAKKIKQDLEDTAAINKKIESLNDKVKDQALQYIVLKKEKDEQVLIN